jgi:hypothetical protein
MGFVYSNLIIKWLKLLIFMLNIGLKSCQAEPVEAGMISLCNPPSTSSG